MTVASTARLLGAAKHAGADDAGLQSGSKCQVLFSATTGPNARDRGATVLAGELCHENRCGRAGGRRHPGVTGPCPATWEGRQVRRLQSADRRAEEEGLGG